MKAKTKTTAICILCAALMAALLLAGCGAQTAEPQSIEAAESTPEPTPTPEPSPTPTPEPELPAGVSVTVNGTAFSGSVVSGDVTYVSTEEFFAALGIDYTESDGMIELTWRGGELSLGGEGTELLSYRGPGYLPVMAVCEQMGISLLDDVEQNHLYCTPAAGDWVVPEGVQNAGFHVSLCGRGCALRFAERAQRQTVGDGGAAQVYCRELISADMV